MADHDVLRGPGRPSLLDRLERWVADARVDEAVRSRTRERGLREAAAQELSLAGMLLDLAEGRGAVAIGTTSGRTHSGAIEVVGADFAAVRLATGASALVPHRAITMVRSRSERDVLGERSGSTDLRLLDVLSELAAEREPAVVITGVDGIVRGVLRTAGRDLVAVRTDGEPPASVYVPATAITEVLVG